MAFDKETLDQIKGVVLEALAEAGAKPQVTANTWPYGDALMSPPDELGRVRLKFVDVDMVNEFGGFRVKYQEATLGGPDPVTKYAEIPELFFMPELRNLTETADVAVGSAQFYQNCAFPLKETTNWFGKKIKVPDQDAGPLVKTFASQWTYDDLKARLIHVARRVRDGKGANMLWNIRTDELDIG